MVGEIRQLKSSEFPKLLSELPDPPETLYLSGTLPTGDLRFLAVVGSRKNSSYGREACERLIEGLRGYPIVIVSGLAMGIDSIAHKAALAAGLQTIAIPGSGLDEQVLYPRAHISLAREIVRAGGALLSEFEPTFAATPWSFPQRNRLMAGLSHAVLVAEAAEQSGSLITARLALDYNRDVYVVPGSIFSAGSAGIHYLMKNGATPIRESADILEALNIPHEKRTLSLNSLSANEREVIALLAEPLPRDTLIEKLELPVHEANVLLSTMELKGLIVEELGAVRIATLP